jgi:hypothetical protein
MHPDLINALHEFADLFEMRGYKYAVIGGIATRVLGIPRPTYDVDFTLSVSREENFSRFSLLNSEQQAVVRDHLELCRVDCDDFILPLISTALSQYWNSPEHVGSKA